MRSPIVLVTALATLGTLCPVLRPVPPKLVWNASASAPIGFYRIDGGESFSVGDLVAVRPPEPLAAFLAERGYLPKGVLLLMYSPNRAKQIEFVSQHLKEGGIFVFVEKFRAVDDNDYARREWQKDFGFKARYFPQDEIEKKKAAVLTTMFNNEVTLQEMSRAVGTHFNHCAMTWNSGNFCSLAASNSRENLNLYLSQMTDPAIPNEYVYEAELHRGLTDYVAAMQQK